MYMLNFFIVWKSDAVRSGVRLCGFMSVVLAERFTLKVALNKMLCKHPNNAFTSIPSHSTFVSVAFTAAPVNVTGAYARLTIALAKITCACAKLTGGHVSLT